MYNLFYLFVLLAALLVALEAVEDPLDDPADDKLSWLGETRKRAQPKKRRLGNNGKNVQCGISNVLEDVGFIRNGQIVEKGDFPWVVRLIELGKRSDIALCGGSIINEYFILTAAHCATKKFINAVIVGDYFINKDDEEETTHEIATKFVHPLYNKKTLRNDIAMLKLSKPINWTQYVRPVCLPDSGQDLEDYANLTVAGFGSIDSTGQNPPILIPSDVLRMANVPLVPQDTCLEAWGPDLYSKEAMICAGQHDSEGILVSDTCIGDSGGPALYRVGNSGWTVFGITSFGDIYCKKLYGVYTRVVNYVAWINETINSRRKGGLKKLSRGQTRSSILSSHQ